MPDTAPGLVVTCEHASNRVPSRAKHLFDSPAAREALTSHRGFDPGAAELARRVAREFSAPASFGEFTRLLIELNRSLHHRALWSEFSRELDAEERRHWIEEYYRPYRDTARTHLRRAIRECGRVVHLGVHSFTPVLNGEIRDVDVGLLYDPGRDGERTLCLSWQERLRAAAPELRVRRNQPYRGVADGFVTELRKEFTDRQYAGIELEVNQAFVQKSGSVWRHLQSLLIKTFAEAAPAVASGVGRI